MDTTHNFKKPYSSFLEGVASEHPDAEGQPDLQKRADEILARRKKARGDARNPQIQRAKKAAAFFSKSAIRKEEVEAVQENKSGDNSLKDWFNKSSGTNPKTGKKVKGWVQLGGSFAGAPCARQPGQTSTPKCGSSKMAGNLSDKEEEKAFKRKNRKDPNQPEKKNAASPTNVRTEEVELQEKEGKKDACYSKVKSRYSVWPSAYASGALVKCRKVGAANWGTQSEESIMEKKMTDMDEKREKALKDRYDNTVMKAKFIKEYGEKEGTKYYFATIRKQAMKEYFELDEAPVQSDVDDEIDQDKNYSNELQKRKKRQQLIQKARQVAQEVEGLSDDYNYELDEAKITKKERGELNQKRRETRDLQLSKRKGNKAFSSKRPQKRYSVDIDDTHTFQGVEGKPDTPIHVLDKEGKVIKHLNNREFNTHKSEKRLKPGESYGFSKFRDVKELDKTGTPNKKLIAHLKRISRREASKVIKNPKRIHAITFNTARGKVLGMHKYLKDKGVNVPPQNIQFTGDMKDDKTTPERKVTLNKANTKRVKKRTGVAPQTTMIDDFSGVLSAHREANTFGKRGGRSRKPTFKTKIIGPYKKGGVMPKPFRPEKRTTINAEFELWVNALLDEGYDLSEFTIDELYEGYEELLDEASNLVATASPGEDKSPHKKAPRPKLPGLKYTQNHTKSTKKPYKEETELTPYEFWKSFIGEEEEVSDETIVEETEEVIERTPTSYDYWKAVITEQNQE
jgi:hypothetical protein